MGYLTTLKRHVGVVVISVFVSVSLQRKTNDNTGEIATKAACFYFVMLEKHNREKRKAEETLHGYYSGGYEGGGSRGQGPMKKQDSMW